MKKMIKIGNKRVGNNYPCFIIAEAGVNHNRSLKMALELVRVAAEAGADAVKFQTFYGGDLATDKAEMVSYQRTNLGVTKSQKAMLRELALPENFYKPIIKECKKKNIIFMSTPHGGETSVDLLENLGVQAYKIGSGDLTNYLLLEKVAKTKKPMIVSTGMSVLREIKDAVSFIRSKHNDKIVVLHCTTDYPCSPKEVNMLAMKTMMDKIDVLIGYSDHTEGIIAAITARSLGAVLYECHFTLDKSLPGPDHVASASPEELKERIRTIRQVETVLGDGNKKPYRSEIKMIPNVRKSIVITRAMKKGDRISRNDLTAKRPAKGGVSPTKYQKFIGKKLKRNLGVDKQISLSDLEK